MTDIVERLRKPMVTGFIHPMDAERAEAADEIERLTMLYENVKHWEAQHLAEIERKDAVIERLLTSNAGYVSEIDRLQAIKDAAIDAASYFHLGGCGEEDFDPQRMGNLMTKLGRALEPKT